MNLLQQQSQQTKKTVRYPANLGILISLLEKQNGYKYKSVIELTNDLHKEFDIEITEKEILDYHSVYDAMEIEQEELSIMIKHGMI
jgi:hypothetical protein